MRVMVIVKASPSSEAGVMPSTELLTAMGKFNEELAKAGVLLDGAGLKPSSKAARVRFSGSQRTVIDGPFAETKELIAGYWIWKVNSLQDAIDWVKKCPNPMDTDSDIEIRPYFEAEDFGEALTPELREKDAATCATALGLNTPAFQMGPEIIVAGLNQHYTRETRFEIPHLWERFVPRASSIPGLVDKTFFGICWNSKSDCSFDYLAGVEVSSTNGIPSDFTSLKLIARRYAVFNHSGHVSAIPRTIDLIWSKWAPHCGLTTSIAPCFERYTAEFNPQTGLGGMEIWIPLES